MFFFFKTGSAATLKANRWWWQLSHQLLSPGGTRAEETRKAVSEAVAQPSSLTQTFGLAWEAAGAAALCEDRRGERRSRQLSAQVRGACAGWHVCRMPAERCVTNLRDSRALAQVLAGHAPRPRICTNVDRLAARAFILSTQHRNGMVLTSFCEATAAPQEENPGSGPGVEQKAPTSHRHDPRGSIP